MFASLTSDTFFDAFIIACAIHFPEVNYSSVNGGDDKFKVKLKRLQLPLFKKKLSTNLSVFILYCEKKTACGRRTNSLNAQKRMRCKARVRFLNRFLHSLQLEDPHIIRVPAGFVISRHDLNNIYV